MVLRSKIKSFPQAPLADAREAVGLITPLEKVALINLGCARNLVDAENLLGQLSVQRAVLSDLNTAHTVIVNTCAFIADAQKETIDTILELVDLKRQKKIKRIIIIGCFSQRYSHLFQKEFPDVDHVFGIRSLKPQEKTTRKILTPASYAYLKICESCYNHCSFCVIPKIKGRFASRVIADIVREAKILDAQGFKEVDLIGQDIAAYGMDCYGHKSLDKLLRALLQATKNIRWFRLLYAFPKHITHELLSTIAQNERICQYIDVPFQHINDRILSSMNRHFSKKQTLSLIDKIRRMLPSAALRTAFIVGYPGETDKMFQELCDFVRHVQFDRVGVFMYSVQEGTSASKIPHQTPDKVKQERYNTLMRLQQEISKKKLKRLVGQTLQILIDKKKDKNVFLGRSQYDAPDVDGIVIVESKKALAVSDMIRAKITASREYDLLAKY